VKTLRLLAVIEATSITGPAKNLLEFARLAAAENVFTTIATFTRGDPDNQFTRAVAELSRSHHGVFLETIPERGPFDPAPLSSLRALASRVKPDIIQTHAVKSHFLVRSAGLPKTAPWVAFHHGYTWPTLKARAYNQLDRWSLRTAKQVLTVSVPFRDQLVAVGVRPGRIQIIHNAIPAAWGAKSCEPAEAARLRAEAGIPAERKVILIVGRLSREKDHLTLLDAVNRLRPAIAPRLIIVGDGPERPRIELKIRQLGLESFVTLTGQQSCAEPWYGLADVAVLSSLSEGSPNALLEAMATNVPVVATAVGGVPEIVTNEESALLVKPGDSEALSAAMARILNEPKLATRLANRSHELILERHTPEARGNKLIAIYRTLASSQPS
jgi:glycosyltransferase involved in cell wall biosynthesis